MISIDLTSKRFSKSCKIGKGLMRKFLKEDEIVPGYSIYSQLTFCEL